MVAAKRAALSSARAGSEAATRSGTSPDLPPVCPATGLYRLLLAAGRPQHGQPVVTAARAAELTGWLDDEQRPDVAELLRDGARVPQETVTARLLAADPGWRDGLRP